MRDTLEALAKGTGLKVRSFVPSSLCDNAEGICIRLAQQQDNIPLRMSRTPSSGTSLRSEQNLTGKDRHSLLFQSLIGGASAIDILVATPGRLMEHLQGTQNFTLQHLRFLVSRSPHALEASLIPLLLLGH